MRSLGVFLDDFVIGDDPVIAVTVVTALGLTAAAISAGVQAWWLLPIAVVVVLTVSLHHATRGGSPEPWDR